MRNRLRLVVVCAPALLASMNAAADSMAVPTVELREEEPGRYVLEAQMAVQIAPGARHPVPPDRCSTADPERADDGGTIRLTYAIDCGDEPLRPRDVLVLPWAVDGIQMKATWANGSTARSLFGREPVGVVVRLHLILEEQETFWDNVLRHGISGWQHVFTAWSHLLLVLVLAVTSLGSFRTVWAALAGFVAGHGVALVLAELGLVWLPWLPADAFLAGTVVLLAAGTTRRLPAVTLVAGTLHGLGMATELVRSGVPASKLVAALFLSNTGVDIGHASAAVAALWIWRLSRSTLTTRRSSLLAVLGTAATVLLFASLQRDWTSSTTRVGASSGFMEMDALTPAPVSASTLGPPPTQTNAVGQLSSPFMSYLIVEPYQIRHEVLVSASAVQHWLEVATDPSGAIPIQAQDSLVDTMTELLAERVAIVIDGAPARAAEKRGSFVSIGPTGVLTRERPMAEPLTTAILGVTFVYETETIATSLALDWGLFSDDVPLVPLTVTDPSATTEFELSAAAPRCEWRNTLEGYELPTIEAISATLPKVPLVSLALAVVALVVVLIGGRTRVALACIVAAYVVYPFARVEAAIPVVGEARIDEEDAAQVTERLLTNVYRCFDIHNEDMIYDRLALTVTGEQLLDIYLESRRALELEDGGGARVRIDEVAVREIRSLRKTEGGGYQLDALWTVGGSVIHFGHVHFRQNRYDAAIKVVPVGGTWKIERVDLLEERRVL